MRLLPVCGEAAFLCLLLKSRHKTALKPGQSIQFRKNFVYDSMNRFIFSLLVYAAAALWPVLATDWVGTPGGDEPVKGSLFLAVDNVRLPEGTIWVGIYESEDDFLDREKARLVAVKVTSTGQAMIQIPDLVYGKSYALALFHDENDNGELDTNFLGLPAEPWAFSGTLKSSFRLPRFDEVRFTFERESSSQVLRLRKWL